MLAQRIYISVTSAGDKETEFFEYEFNPREAHLLALLASALGERMGTTKPTPQLVLHAAMIQLGRLAAEMHLAQGFINEEVLMSALGVPQATPAPKSRNGGRK